jgi:hypothetical protein
MLHVYQTLVDIQCKMPTWCGLWSCGWSALSTGWVVACYCLSFSSWFNCLFWPFSSWVTPCPAPPGAAAVGLTFSSWDDLELQVTPYQLLGVVRMVWWTVEELCVLVCAVLVLVDWEQLAPDRANLLHQQLLWFAVVLTTPKPSHGDWAACKQLLCLPSCLIWSLPLLLWRWRCQSARCTLFCTKFLRTDTSLDHLTQWCNWQYNCQCLRVKLY